MSTPPAAPADPHAPDAPDPAATAAGRRDPRIVRFVVVLVLWAGAAVLSVLSAFAGLYTVSVAGKGINLNYSVSVAGDYTGRAAAFVLHGGVHYTLILALCAIAFGLLVVASVGRLLDLPTGPQLDLAILAGGFAVPGVLAGVLVSLYLQTNSTLNTVRTQIHGNGFRASTAIDAGPYLALGALLCAVLAVAATLWRRVGTGT